MTTPVSTFTLFLPLFLLFSSTFSPITPTSLIAETCMKCSQNGPNLSYRFCLTSLQAAPNSSHTGLPKFSLISMRIVQRYVTNRKHFIKHLLKNNTTNKYVRACLDDCLELYTDTIPTIKQAVKDYKKKHNEDANIKVSSIVDASMTCEDGFQGRLMVSPLTKRNNETFQLCIMAHSTQNHIMKNSTQTMGVSRNTTNPEKLIR